MSTKKSPVKKKPSKLTGTSREGDAIHAAQQMGAESGHRNVAQAWLDTTISFQEGFELLEKERAESEDIRATLGEMVPVVNDAGKFVFQYKDGREYDATDWALGQVGINGKCGTWTIKELRTNPVNTKDEVLFVRDREDAETLVHILKNAFRRIESDKVFLWRTSKNGVLRALLTDLYNIIDNRWFLEILQEQIPGGRLSHWQGDSDTLYGNILIPDTIRLEEDSEYGGMLSVGNSEIGVRRLSSLPSVFRAICQNGAVWGQKEGVAVRKVHKGKSDLAELKTRIIENLNVQIPLLPQGIDKLLSLRNLGWNPEDVSPKVVIAELARDLKLDRREATGVLEGYRSEVTAVPTSRNTLFGLTNAVTRAAQLFDPATWVTLDELGGKMLDWAPGWDTFIKRACKRSTEDVDSMFLAA
jgi:hypothetical protein